MGNQWKSSNLHLSTGGIRIVSFGGGITSKLWQNYLDAFLGFAQQIKDYISIFSIVFFATWVPNGPKTNTNMGFKNGYKGSNENF